MPGMLDALRDVKAHVGQQVHLGQEQHISRRKDMRVLQGLVVSFNHRQEHHSLGFPEIEVRWTDQIPDILNKSAIMLSLQRHFL